MPSRHKTAAAGLTHDRRDCVLLVNKHEHKNKWIRGNEWRQNVAKSIWARKQASKPGVVLSNDYDA